MNFKINKWNRTDFLLGLVLIIMGLGIVLMIIGYSQNNTGLMTLGFALFGIPYIIFRFFIKIEKS